MVIVAVPVLPRLSVALIVITLSPSKRSTFEIFQLIVLLSVSSAPLLVLHTTLFISLVLSEAFPLMFIVLLVVLKVEPDVGFVIVIAGGVVSTTIESLAPPEIFPEASLYHTYIVFLPASPLKVYETSSL